MLKSVIFAIAMLALMQYLKDRASIVATHTDKNETIYGVTCMRMFINIPAELETTPECPERFHDKISGERVYFRAINGSIYGMHAIPLRDIVTISVFKIIGRKLPEEGADKIKVKMSEDTSLKYDYFTQAFIRPLFREEITAKRGEIIVRRYS